MSSGPIAMLWIRRPLRCCAEDRILSPRARSTEMRRRSEELAGTDQSWRRWRSFIRAGRAWLRSSVRPRRRATGARRSTLHRRWRPGRPSRKAIRLRGTGWLRLLRWIPRRFRPAGGGGALRREFRIGDRMCTHRCPSRRPGIPIARRCLRAWFNKAVEWQLVRVNPVLKSQTIKVDRESAQGATADRACELLSAFRKAPTAYPLAFALGTGLRIYE